MVKVDSELISKLEKKLLEIDNSSLDDKNKLGKIGEAFVKDGIKITLWNKKLDIGRIGNDKFSIKEQYKADGKGMGGIDFYIKFRFNGVKYRCFVEVKNWMKMRYITPDTFKKHILDRFEKLDRRNKKHRIVVMNKRNIHLINKNCKQNNINIIPLEEHITSQMLNIIILKRIMKHFVDDFSILVDDIIKGRVQVNINPCLKWLRMKKLQIQNNKIYGMYKGFRKGKTEKKELNKTDRIKEDIRKGLPYDVIVKKHNTTTNNVKKIKSKMVKDGEKLLDRRTKEWKGMQLMKSDEGEGS